MKKVWVNFSMFVSVTDEEYEELKENALDKENTLAWGHRIYQDMEVYPDWFTKKIVLTSELDLNDSYMPAAVWENDRDKFTDEEIEEKYKELANVLFIEDEAGHLKLEDDWWLFESGTDREEIWDWMGSMHSKGFLWMYENIEV